MAQNSGNASLQVESVKTAGILRLAFYMSAAVALVAAMILICWLVDPALLCLTTPSHMIAKANTALGMMFLAIASALTLRPHPANGRRWVAYGCAAITMALATLTLAEYVLQCNLGIDELLVRDVLAAPDSAPGRVPRVTALGFLTMGAALIAQTNILKPMLTLSRVFLWLTSLVAAQALIGYVIDLDVLLGAAIHTQMSLHSTGMFMTLCAAQLMGQRALYGQKRMPDAAEDSAFQGRLLLIAIFMPPLVQSFIQQSQRAGFLSDDFSMGIQVTVNSVLMLVIIHLSLRSLRKRSEQIAREQMRVAQLSEHVEVVEREKAELYAERLVAKITRENEERLQTTLDGAFDAVVSMDAEGLVCAWNAKAEKMFGWQKEAALGRRLGDLLVPEEQREAHSIGLKRYVESGHEVLLNREIEVEACRADGSRLPVRLYITPVQVGGKKTFTGFISDITLRRKAEDELRRAQVRAEQAASVKSQFLAHMSHEIRTPLNGILGMTDTLLDTALNASQAQTVNILQGAGQQLLDVVNDILDFSKMEAGHLQLESIAFNLRSIVSQQVELLRSKAHDKGLQLHCEVDGTVPSYVRGDSTRLSQVILNLLSNGIKFTNAGEVTLRIHAVQGGLRFSVQDSGIGMSPDVRRGLFEPFYQADSSTSRRYGGTGLGLAISRQLVELMGGTLSVASVLGQGSTFSFELPLQAADQPAPEPQVREPAGIGTISIAGHPPLVLVAEDNEVNRMVVSAHLKKLGCEVRMVDNGRKAVEAVKDKHFDIVLMDCHMPEMDGFEATSLIRAYESEHDQHTPIVALTASALAEDVARCLRAGMDAHLCKPIRLATFAQVLRHHLGEPRS